MNAVLHLFEPEEHAARLIAAPYIDAELLGVVASVDEAPKLAHSLAIGAVFCKQRPRIVAEQVN